MFGMGGEKDCGQNYGRRLRASGIEKVGRDDNKRNSTIKGEQPLWVQASKVSQGDKVGGET